MSTKNDGISLRYREESNGFEERHLDLLSGRGIMFPSQTWQGGVGYDGSMPISYSPAALGISAHVSAEGLMCTMPQITKCRFLFEVVIEFLSRK